MSGKGNITRRGARSWRVKFDTGRDQATGKRKISLITVRGTKREAQAELTRQLAALDGGAFVEPSKVTVADWLARWLDDKAALYVSAKTLERYRELVSGQIVPHLGAVCLQKLRPAEIESWHAKLLKCGGRRGGPLSPSTVRQAHRVLQKAIGDAQRVEVVPRNVAGAVRPPPVVHREAGTLDGGQMVDVLTRLAGHPLHALAVMALATGARRGELLALRWGDVDLDGARVRIERSLEQTKGGLAFKSPKTAAGRRTVSVPPAAIDALRAHRKAQLELRVALGLGRLPDDALVFASLDGSPRPPHTVSDAWRRAVSARGLPKVPFHALRHAHASALIAAGLDVVTVSRRLGHASPAITLTVYSHLFSDSDSRAADAIGAALGTAAERSRD